MWTVAFKLLDIGVQLSARRWIAGRSLAAYQAAYLRRHRLRQLGLGPSYRCSLGSSCAAYLAALMLPPLLGLRMPRISAPDDDIEALADPEERLPLTDRSGPLEVEIEYRVAPANARAFHNVMHEIQLSRQRLWLADCTQYSSIPSCGSSAITAHPGWIIHAFAIARPSRDSTLDHQAALYHIAPTRYSSIACWNARSDLCAGRTTCPTGIRTRPFLLMASAPPRVG
ncbi:MFS transporter [Bradyrhizobium brasilense]|uniref:MFS transporter n=1 Tax=Bradyrhizobium brasilense TaxID=1419277 RepID=UPI0035C6FB75